MLDKEFCKLQIARLGQMDRFPDNKPQAMLELVKRLQLADDEKMAERIVSDFIDCASHETRCPMPGDIASEVHKRMTERYGDFLPDPECPSCEGTAFKRVLMSDGMPGSGPRCECVARRKPVTARKSTSEFDGQIAEAAGRLRG